MIEAVFQGVVTVEQAVTAYADLLADIDAQGFLVTPMHVWEDGPDKVHVVWETDDVVGEYTLVFTFAQRTPAAVLDFASQISRMHSDVTGLKAVGRYADVQA